jgi:hypothetical protein
MLDFLTIQPAIIALTASLREQAAQIQKVSAQLEASKPCAASGQQSLKPRPHFTISRRASPRGGFCVARQSGLSSGLFEIAMARSIWINAGHRTPLLI